VTDCIFCKIKDRTIPSTMVHETDDLFVIKDIAPKAPVHLLIIPKKHVADIQSLSPEDNALMGNMMMAAQEVGNKILGGKAFRLVINSGAGVGQKVFHVHMHVLGGAVMHDL
jgi:histidine triad (HIT) family protein